MSDRDSIVGKVIGLAIGLFIAAALLPTAITNLFAANTTTWSTEAQTMWTTVGLLAVVAFAIVIVYVAIQRNRA